MAYNALCISGRELDCHNRGTYAMSTQDHLVGCQLHGGLLRQARTRVFGEVFTFVYKF